MENNDILSTEEKASELIAKATVASKNVRKFSLSYNKYLEGAKLTIADKGNSKVASDKAICNQTVENAKKLKAYLNTILDNFDNIYAEFVKLEVPDDLFDNMDYIWRVVTDARNVLLQDLDSIINYKIIGVEIVNDTHK